MKIEAPHVERRARRRISAELIGLGLLAMLALPVATSAGTSSVWVVEVAGGARSASALHFGDRFTVGYKSQEKQPWAHAVCYANDTTLTTGSGGAVWGSWFSLWAGGPTPQNFVLGDSVEPTWVGGGADCVVELVKTSGKYLGALGFSNETVLARTSFTVAP
jgi:hypothetical protein